MRRPIAVNCRVMITVALLSGIAQADLVVNVEGNVGAGTSLWTFSGSSTTDLLDTLEATSTAVFNTGSDGQFGDFIADTTLSDQRFTPISGSATIFFGTGEFQESRTITRVFLDYDAGSPNNSDFGIRVNSAYEYGPGIPTSWIGSFVMPIEISRLNAGTFLNNVSAPNYANGLNSVRLIIASNAVPEPASLALMGVAALGTLGLRRFGRTNRVS